jgi:hypothetical protein
MERNGGFRVLKDGQEIETVDQWFLLAPPKKGKDQWRKGRSAQECARAWCNEPFKTTVPSEIIALIDSNEDTVGATFVTATPEHCIGFDSLRGGPRNADIVALANHPGGLIAINIEAKADETFDLLVSEVLSRAVRKIVSEEPTNAVLRVQQLSAAMLPPAEEGTPKVGELRYQLLTGAAGAIAHAIKEHACCAVFIVHEFISSETQDVKHRANEEDWNRFVKRMTRGAIASLAPGRLVGPITVPGAPLFRSPPPLYMGKAVRDLREGAG